MTVLPGDPKYIRYYVYHFKSGRNAKITHKELIVHFTGDKISRVTGDYELSSDFNTPLELSSLPSATEADLKPLLPEVRPDAAPLVEENRPTLTNQPEKTNEPG